MQQPSRFTGCAGVRRGNALRFYSWKSYGGVGEALVEPRWISWDPDTSVAALAYPDAIVFCRAQPSFSAFASLSLQVIHPCPLHPQGLNLRHLVHLVPPGIPHLQ